MDQKARPSGGGGAADTVHHLVLVGETRSLFIEDAVVAELALGLDGTRETAEIVESLAPRVSRRSAAHALRRLRALDVLADGAPDLPLAEAAGWDARGVSPDRAAGWLRDGHVAVADDGGVAAQLLVEALRRLGPVVRRVGLDDELPGQDPTAPLVVAVDSVLDPRLGAVNAGCLAEQRSWTLVRPMGTVMFLGPHLRPGETGCWECLRQRYAENEQLENYLAERLPGQHRVSAARAALAPSIAALAGLLVAELPVLVEHGRSPRLTGRLVALDTVALTTSSHVLVRQPQCPACGRPELTRTVGPRVTIEAAAARPDPDSGTRTASATSTYERLAHHVSRYLGVVTRLTPLEPDDLTHSYSAGHNFAIGRTPAMLRANLRGQSGGKGRTDRQARISAVGEAIERSCGVWRDDRPTHRASYRRLGPDRAVHATALLGFSADQYARREELNPELGHFHRIPRVVPDDLELSWTTGWSLTREVPRDLPAAYCWYGHPELSTLDICGADSNGCAAGSTVAEAVLQGFAELVERDSVALWWYHRSRVPGVDLDSFADPWIAALRRHYTRVLGRELWALDITADLGIPAFAAVSRSVVRPTQEVLVGFGAHPHPAVALSRALTELNQFLPAVRPGAPVAADGTVRYGVAEPETLRWLATVRVEEEPWLCPSPDLPATTVDTYVDWSTGDVGADVQACVGRAERAGLEVIVVDQSRPDVELAVVKVVVPGLRHFWRRLGPGRLWEVPPRLGRAPVAATEDAVNPLSVFF